MIRLMDGDQRMVTCIKRWVLSCYTSPWLCPASGKWDAHNLYLSTQAYLEFFVAPDLLSELVRRIERDPRITYYAVNRQGDLRTNTHSEGPNAVTWGVFPGKEIIQPTIVEAVSFIAWKDEAFELGNQWATLYEEGSESRELIESVMSTSYLVNIVANDFRDGLSIFEPFQLDKVASTVVPSSVDGLVNGAVDAAKVAKETVVNGTTAAAATVVETVKSVIPVIVNGSSKETASTKGGDAIAVNGSAAQEEEVPTVEEATAVPGPAPRKKTTMADLDDIFDKSPIFMRKAPEAGEENPAFDALRSLVFEGTGDGKSRSAPTTQS